MTRAAHLALTSADLDTWLPILSLEGEALEVEALERMHDAIINAPARPPPIGWIEITLNERDLLFGEWLNHMLPRPAIRDDGSPINLDVTRSAS